MMRVWRCIFFFIMLRDALAGLNMFYSLSEECDLPATLHKAGG
jgi:hypothetical protein